MSAVAKSCTSAARSVPRYLSESTGGRTKERVQRPITFVLDHYGTQGCIMQNADTMDSADELQLHDDTKLVHGQNHNDDKLKRQANELFDELEGALAVNSRTMENVILLRTIMGESWWDKEREECLKMRRKLLWHREQVRAEHHNLVMRNPSRIETVENVSLPFVIGFIVSWKLLTSPS